ncbi:MAG: TatD family hydrolase [Candidatus Yonathbacteria bacterium]|nr:TatD family hydrolase [Candidatus Yonathbacteria bacterium]
MKMKFFDIHSHIQFPPYENDREEVIARMEREEVGTIVVGTEKDSSEKAVVLAEAHEGVFASVGLHPNDTAHENFDEHFYRQLLSHKKTVAVGECGLDYFRTEGTEENKKRQKEILERHIDLAVEFNKPLMIHCRDAYDDLITILSEKKKEHGAALRGNIHFFAGNLEIAQKFLELNFTLSFTGVITFTHDYDEVIKNVPLEMIMTETDCPYVTPVPHRGERNEPAYVIEVVKKISEIRGESFEKVRDQVRENVRRVFNV